MTLLSQPEAAERGGTVTETMPVPPPLSDSTEPPPPVPPAAAAAASWPKFNFTWPKFNLPWPAIRRAAIQQLKIAITLLVLSIVAYYAFSKFFVTTVVVQGASM